MYLYHGNFSLLRGDGLVFGVIPPVIITPGSTQTIFTAHYIPSPKQNLLCLSKVK